MARAPSAAADSWRERDGDSRRRTACPVLYRYRLIHTYCLLARLPLLTYYSSARPFSTTCSGQMAQTGLTDSATSPVIVLYSHALCARLRVFA